MAVVACIRHGERFQITAPRPQDRVLSRQNLNPGHYTQFGDSTGPRGLVGPVVVSLKPGVWFVALCTLPGWSICGIGPPAKAPVAARSNNYDIAKTLNRIRHSFRLIMKQTWRGRTEFRSGKTRRGRGTARPSATLTRSPRKLFLMQQRRREQDRKAPGAFYGPAGPRAARAGGWACGTKYIWPTLDWRAWP
jgi:hypothetical protein